ncbi:MAG TPA: hypothetical protein DCQ87_06115 [Lachnospiraceae bacterium]|nr:hypothetical protein [Lachnospiraceae bacterium]
MSVKKLKSLLQKIPKQCIVSLRTIGCANAARSVEVLGRKRCKESPKAIQLKKKTLKSIKLIP